MITLEELKKISEITTFDVFIRLYILSKGGSYMFPSLSWDDLKLGGYCNFQLELTKKGRELLESVQPSKKIDTNFYKELHKKLQNELFILTGKKQKVIGGKYSFLCNAFDLEHKLSRLIKKHQITDLKRIEKLLLKYIHTCYKADFKMVQLLEYYIEKSGTSKLMTDFESFEEKDLDISEKSTTFDGVNI